MKQLRLKESYTQYANVTRNAYGDNVPGAITGTGLCLYRDISTLNSNVNYRDEVNIQGIFWFAPSDPHNKADIIEYNGVFYRLEQVVKGKELVSSNNVHFYKCTASLLRQLS